MDIRPGVIRAYDRATHTATVELAGSQAVYLGGVPVSHALGWWLVEPGASCAVIFFDETNPGDACVVLVYGGVPARDPHFDPALGHRHRGVADDGPVL